MPTSKTKRRKAVTRKKVVRQKAVLLYSVSGGYEDGGEAMEYVSKSNEREAALFARTVLEFDIVTEVKLVHDCVWI